MRSNIRFTWLVIMCTALLTQHKALAADVLIQASYRPDPANPSRNVFKNDTPPGDSYCGWAPQYCQNGRYSIGLPVKFRAIADIQPGHDVRHGAMFQVPTLWRDMTVLNDATGDTETLRFRVSGISAAYVITTELEAGTWDAPWVYAPPPCLYGGTSYGTPHFYAFSWLAPEGAGVCAKEAFKPVPLSMNFSYRSTGFIYELVTPNPLNLTAGVYRGRTVYTVGPYKDFDAGDVMLPDDDQVTLEFELTVDHLLKVEVPPGGNRIVLEPQGGWQAWLNNGRKPSRLFRDQTVNIWSSSHFKMNLECGEPVGNTCSLRNAAGHQVPLDVAVTLPPGLSDSAGCPVNRLPLRLDGSGTELFQPSRYIDRKPSTLHFEVKADGVSQMLDQGGGTYNGAVTVVWDSQV